MTLLRALVSRFSALLGNVYYEGTVPPDAPYPYAVVSAKIPAAFGGAGEITLCCYERGGDSHTRIAEKMARVMRFSGSLVHYGGGLALLQFPIFSGIGMAEAFGCSLGYGIAAAG